MKRRSYGKILLAAGVLALSLFCCSPAFGNIVYTFSFKREMDYGHPERVIINDRPAGGPYALPIIMYHAAYPDSVGKYNILPRQLEKDLIYIRENNFNPVLVSDLIGFQEKGRALPENPVMITFDDAALSFYLYAWPLLKEYNVKFILSPVGALTDANYGADGKIIKDKRSHMNWEQLKELYDSGLCELQSHTYNMHKQTKARLGLKRNRHESPEEYKEAVCADLDKMQKRVYEKTGAVCSAVAYPYGAYTKELGPILKESGFKAGFTCRERINYIEKDSSLFFLSRFNRPGNMSSKDFFQKKMKIK